MVYKFDRVLMFVSIVLQVRDGNASMPLELVASQIVLLVGSYYIQLLLGGDPYYIFI
jgi:hypothetical protein